MNSFTLTYKMNNQIAFLARVTPETSLDIFIFLSGTFTYTVTDEKRWNDIRLPDSLLKKGFEAYLITPVYETGKKLSMPDELKDHVPEILEAASESAAAQWARYGICLAGLTIDDVEIAPGDKRMMDEIKTRYMISSHETPAADMLKNPAIIYDRPQIQVMSPAAMTDMKTAMEFGRKKASSSSAGSWVCSCGKENTGKFCPECGSPREWVCECGQMNSGNFCTECGKKRR